MRIFRCGQLAALILAGVTVLSAGVFAAPPQPELRARSFAAMAGESYGYRLDFLIFKDLAEGTLRLAAGEHPGRYRAELVARTLGVASWLSGDRTQSYLSVMEEDPAGGLRSVTHESRIHKRKWGSWSDRRKRYRFDYQARKVYQEKGEAGVFVPGQLFALPVGQTPVDILTGFYNLRAGVYGRLIPGAHLQIPTFTTRGISVIDVDVLPESARLARPFFPAGGTLLRVRVDPEVFETGDAALFVWFDAAGRPARGIVENVIGLGDVYGRLREEPVLP